MSSRFDLQEQDKCLEVSDELPPALFGFLGGHHLTTEDIALLQILVLYAGLAPPKKLFGYRRNPWTSS